LASVWDPWPWKKKRKRKGQAFFIDRDFSAGWKHGVSRVPDSNVLGSDDTA
jgi:hypothetical protein